MDMHIHVERLRSRKRSQLIFVKLISGDVEHEAHFGNIVQEEGGQRRLDKLKSKA